MQLPPQLPTPGAFSYSTFSVGPTHVAWAASTSGAAEHRFVLRGAKGGDVALAAPAAADKAEWIAALGRQAARFVQRLRGGG